jgi:hypothetical protein
MRRDVEALSRSWGCCNQEKIRNGEQVHFDDAH